MRVKYSFTIFGHTHTLFQWIMGKLSVKPFTRLHKFLQLIQGQDFKFHSVSPFVCIFVCLLTLHLVQLTKLLEGYSFASVTSVINEVAG